MNTTQLCATFDPEVRLSSPMTLRGDLSFIARGPEDPVLLHRMLERQSQVTLTGFPMGFHQCAYQVDERTLHSLFLPSFVQPFVAGKGLVNGQTSMRLLQSYPMPARGNHVEGRPYEDAYCLLQNRHGVLPWHGNVVVYGWKGSELARLLGGKRWHFRQTVEKDVLLVVCIRKKMKKWDEMRPWQAGSFPIWPHTLVILECESALETESWKHQVDAIMTTFTENPHPQKLADIIRGREDPTGRLPYTMPLLLPPGWKVAHGTMKPADRWQTVRVPPFFGYRANEKGSFCFGHGLSYTRFRFDGLQIGSEVLSFRVTNIGRFSGSASIQVYLQHLERKYPQPRSILRDFRRIFLKTGASEEVSIPLDDRFFTIWDENCWSFVPKRDHCVVEIGTSSEEICLTAELFGP